MQMKLDMKVMKRNYKNYKYSEKYTNIENIQ